MKATKFSQYLQDREELQFIDRPHWIYLVEAIFWSLVIILVGILSHNFIASSFIFPRLAANPYADGFLLNIAAYASQILFWGAFFIAILYFLNRLIYWASTYIFASDRRIYLKTGLVRVMVSEVSFEEIRKTDINYGLIGRFLGYGKLILDARFVEDTDELPYSYCPEKFVKIIHHANDLAGDINISYVTKGMVDEAEQKLPKRHNVSSQVPSQRQHEEFVKNSPYNYEENNSKKSKQDETFQEGYEEQEERPPLEKPAETGLKKMDI